MSPERVLDREIAGSESQGRTAGFGERLGARLASPIGVLLVVPGLVLAVGLFLTLLGQKALRESTTLLSRERLFEQTSFAARSIASSLSHADPLLDRMGALASAWDGTEPIGPVAHTLRGLMHGRPGVAYVSVSFPNGAFRGVYLEQGRSRFVDSHMTAAGSVARRYELVGVDGLELVEEVPWGYDPRSRDFYRDALRERRRVWTKPYTFYLSHQTGVTRTEPVFDAAGALRAVLTVDFDVLALSKSMSAAPLPGAKTLLYTSDGTLLAYPEGAAVLATMKGLPNRPVGIGDLGDARLAAFFAATRAGPAVPGQFMSFFEDTEPMLAMVTPVPTFPELGWNVGAIVSEGVLFRARIQHERQSAWVAALSLLLALAIAVIFARHVVRVRRLAVSASDRAKELGSYKLVELLGKGGMGEVWRAEHRLLAREAAIKLIRTEKVAASPQSTANLRRRFRREAQTLATLKSRHTISLFDYGVTGDGTFFFVMELLDGLDLDTLVRQDGPQPPGRVIRFLLQALSSLAEAHDAGLVHRDVKPANLFVCRAADEVDIVKVLDFGIVQSARERRSDPPPPTTLAELVKSQITQAGQLLGTPAFMSPEQVLGQPTDGRADLYALGCVGLFLLSGKVPFEGETVLATLVAHVAQPFDAAAVLPPSVPTELVRVLAWCLEKAPEDRPPDARGLAAALAAIELSPEDQWTPERARAWWADRQATQGNRTPLEPTRQFEVVRLASGSASVR